MGQNTSRLGLYLPGGGSTGLITPDEPADIDKINDNMQKLDTDAGAYVCTSSTRPSSPYNGKIIFETDTRKTMVYKSATTSWEPVDSQGKIVANAAARDALFASPTQGTKVFRTDTGVTETYYAAWNASTNPGGKTPAGWYVAERSTGLVPIVPPTVAVSGGSATVNSLGTISFSAATSLSLNSVFTSAYENYILLIKLDAATASTNLRFRLRSGGTDQTGTYNWGGAIAPSSGGVVQNFNSPGVSYVAIGDVSNQAATQLTNEFALFSPQLAKRTAFSSKIMFDNGTNVYGGAFGGTYQPTTQCDGFSLYLGAAGNFSGTVQVLGYNS